jgi:serine/threonine protein kinase
MEIVYRGRHHSPERIVAIRMMKRTAFSSAGDVQRILNEANVASQMEHAAVVAFYGTRGCQGEPFITMKFNDGETLSRVLKCDEISRTDAIRKLCVVSHNCRRTWHCSLPSEAVPHSGRSKVKEGVGYGFRIGEDSGDGRQSDSSRRHRGCV